MIKYTVETENIWILLQYKIAVFYVNILYPDPSEIILILEIVNVESIFLWKLWQTLIIWLTWSSQRQHLFITEIYLGSHLPIVNALTNIN